MMDDDDIVLCEKHRSVRGSIALVHKRIRATIQYCESEQSTFDAAATILLIANGFMAGTRPKNWVGELAKNQKFNL